MWRRHPVRMGLAALVLVGLASLSCQPANAAVTIVATQESDNTVVFTTTGGALDLSAWSYVSDASVPTVIHPSAGLFQMAFGTIDYYDSPQDLVVAGPFGTGGQTSAASISGPFNLDVGIDPVAGQLIVPANYVSNAPIPGGEMVFDGTYESLGITPGNYTWSWGSGATADSLTLQIDAIPEPGSLGLLGLGFASLAAWRRRPRARAAGSSSRRQRPPVGRSIHEH